MAVTTRERHNALLLQKQAIVEQRDGLKAEHAQAFIAGGTFSKQPQISSLNHEIEALEVAIAELDAKATVEEERAHAASKADALQRKIDTITSDEAAYLAIVEKLEANVKSSGELLKQLHELSHGMYNTIAGLGSSMNGHAAELDGTNISQRISLRIGLVLSKVLVAGRYGIFHWAAEQDRPCDWVAEEKQALSGQTQHAIKTLKQRIGELRAQAVAE